MSSLLEVPGTGRAIVLASWYGTVLFGLVELGGILFPHGLGIVVTIVDVALFGVGVALFFWAYAIAVGRSRHDEISVAGLYLMQESAPPEVRRALLLPVVLQVVIGIAAALFRLYSSLAFGVLVPMYGLGLAGLWAARHGVFPPRVRSPR